MSLRPDRRLFVRLHGEPAGEIIEERDGRICFRLSESYHALVPRPVLGQKFEDDPERTSCGRRRGALPDFFANAIPEEGPLRRILLQAMEAEDPDDLDLLAFVGHDLPGAVTVHADLREEPPPAGWPDEIEAPEADGEEGADAPLRFSLAGVQLKFSMLKQDESLTLPAAGRDGRWIVKFPSPTFSRLPENEHAILSWARDAGFDVPDTELQGRELLPPRLRKFAPQGEPVLAIRRFDRSDTGRIHQEDLAQAVGLSPSHKYDHMTYEAMARLILRFIGDEAVDELVRRLVLVIASGNSDAHLKNWSLVYPDRIRAEWSPLYDQVATVAWALPERCLSLKLAGVRDFHRIDLPALHRFAERADRSPSAVEDVAAETLTALAAHREAVLERLPPGHDDALQTHWKNTPLLKAMGLPG